MSFSLPETQEVGPGQSSYQLKGEGQGEDTERLHAVSRCDPRSCRRKDLENSAPPLPGGVAAMFLTFVVGQKGTRRGQLTVAEDWGDVCVLAAPRVSHGGQVPEPSTGTREEGRACGEGRAWAGAGTQDGKNTRTGAMSGPALLSIPAYLLSPGQCRTNSPGVRKLCTPSEQLHPRPAGLVCELGQ